MEPTVSYDWFVYGVGRDSRATNDVFMSLTATRAEFWQWYCEEYRDETWSLTGLSQRFQVGKSSITRWFRQLGGKRRRDENVEIFREWFLANRGDVEAPCINELTKRFGFSKNGIKSLVNRWGGWTYDPDERERVLRKRRAAKLKENGRVSRRERALNKKEETYETFVLGEGKVLNNFTGAYFQNHQETRAAFWHWFHFTYTPGAKVCYRRLAKKFNISRTTARMWFLALGGERQNKGLVFGAFKSWFIANRDSTDVPSNKELARRFRASETSIGRWIRKLGGFRSGSSARRRFERTIQAASEALADAPPQLCFKGFMREAGIPARSTRRGRAVLAELRRRGDPNVSKVVPHAPHKHSPESIGFFAYEFQLEHGRRPTLRDVSDWLEIDAKRVRARLTRFFIAGKLDREDFDLDRSARANRSILDEEEAFWRAITQGEKTRPQAWLESVERRKGLGYEFAGEYWDRYYAIWLKKSKRDRGLDDDKMK